MNDHPTGKEMIARTRGVGRMVDEILPRIRSTSGGYNQLAFRVWQRYYKDKVKISYDKETTSFHMHFYKFKYVYLVPAFETIRRRAQERFHHQKEIYWRMVASRLGIYYHADSELSKMDDEERRRALAWREMDEAQALFLELSKGDIYLPTGKTIGKRKVLEEEYRKEYGIQTNLEGRI